MTHPAVAPFPPVTIDSGNGEIVADAMIACPRTHDLDTDVDAIRAFFEDSHVHLALIVGAAGQLVTTIERSDLPGRSASVAAELGTLAGRTADPAAPLDIVTAALLRARRRRLAVVDDCGRLLGLLCLKKDGTGYCSDDDIRERVSAAAPNAGCLSALTGDLGNRHPPSLRS